MQRLFSIIASATVGALLTLPLVAATEPVVVIRRATIVAFFTPVTQADLKNDPDTNEALADFQFYAGKVRKPLHDAGVDFQEVYARSFRVQRGIRTTIFSPGRVDVGYYFAAPGKEPRVEYGVMTDTDLLEMAKEYFALNTAPQPSPAHHDRRDAANSPQKLVP